MLIQYDAEFSKKSDLECLIFSFTVGKTKSLDSDTYGKLR